MKSPQSKTSGIFTGDTLGTAAATPRGRYTVELAYVGYSSRATSQRSLALADDVLRDDPERSAVVFNLLAHTGDDPGNLALGIRWAASHHGRLLRAALVTRSTAFAAVLSVAKVMLPKLPVRTFTNVADAVAWCEGSAHDVSRSA